MNKKKIQRLEKVQLCITVITLLFGFVGYGYLVYGFSEFQLNCILTSSLNLIMLTFICIGLIDLVVIIFKRKFLEVSKDFQALKMCMMSSQIERMKTITFYVNKKKSIRE